MIKEKMTDYHLTISPALEPEERHKLEKALDGLSYEVTGSGMMIDGSECDISFFNRKDLPLQKRVKR